MAVSATAAEPRGLAEFHSSVECGLMSAIKDVLKSTNDISRYVNIPTAKGVSPLMLSVLNPSSPSVPNWLLAHGALVNYVQPDSGQTALHWACTVHNPQAVMSLLREGALADVADTHGRTPLHYAALVGSEYVAHKLLKYCSQQLERRILSGGDVGSLALLSPAAQQAAAHAAATGQPMPIIPLDPSLLSLPRDTLGAFAAQALLNRPDLSGYTPLMLACEHGREAMVGFLLSRGAETHHRSKVGHTALVLADWYGHTGCRTAVEQHMTVFSPPPVSAAALPHQGGMSPMDSSGAGTPSLMALPGAAGVLAGTVGAGPGGVGVGGQTPLMLPPGSVSYGGMGLPHNAWMASGAVGGSTGASPVVSGGPSVGLVHGLGMGMGMGMGVSVGMGMGMGGGTGATAGGSGDISMAGSMSRDSQHSTGGRLSGGSVGLIRSGAIPGGLPLSSTGGATGGVAGLSSSSAGSASVVGMVGAGWPAATGASAAAAARSSKLGAPMAGPAVGASAATAASSASSAASSSYTLPKGATQHTPLHVHTTSVAMGRALTEALGFTYPNPAAPPAAAGQ